MWKSTHVSLVCVRLEVRTQNICSCVHCQDMDQKFHAHHDVWFNDTILIWIILIGLSSQFVMSHLVDLWLKGAFLLDFVIQLVDNRLDFGSLLGCVQLSSFVYIVCVIKVGAFDHIQ